MRVFSTLLLSVSLLFSVATAQPKAKKDPGKQSAEDPKKLFEQAEAHYRIQEYATALELYKKAYLLSLQPGLLFNIGQCQRQLKMYEEAIRSYKSYLNESPQSPIKDRVLELIKETEALLTSTKEPSSQPASQPISKPTSQPTTTPTSAPTSNQSGVVIGASTQAAQLAPAPQKASLSLSPFLYGTAALSGALGLGAGALYLSSRANAAASLAQNDVTLAQEAELYTNRAKAFGLLSNALVGVGVASAVAGVFFAKKHKEQKPQVNPTPAGVTFSQSF